MFVPTVYLCLAFLGLASSLYLTARAFHCAVRAGKVEAAAGRVFDRVENPEAFYGVLIGWVLIDAIIIPSSFVLLQIWIEQFKQ